MLQYIIYGLYIRRIIILLVLNYKSAKNIINHSIIVARLRDHETISYFAYSAFDIHRLST